MQEQDCEGLKNLPANRRRERNLKRGVRSSLSGDCQRRSPGEQMDRTGDAGRFAFPPYEAIESNRTLKRTAIPAGRRRPAKQNQAAAAASDGNSA